MSLITLTTDFGPGEYVAQVKGVILSLLPGAEIVDVSHEIRPGDILQAAYVMEITVPAFPPDTVGIVVVDPGVGTDRRALAVRYAGRTLVGPDNGCLTAFLSDAEAIHEITEDCLFLPEVSATFHGRDIFAPVAAFLAGGGEISAVGPPLTGDAVRIEGLHADGEEGLVLHVDRFGNLITSFSAESIVPGVAVEGPGACVETQVHTFADAPDDDAFLYAGSGGRMEIATNGGRAEDRLGWHSGTRLRIRSEP